MLERAIKLAIDAHHGQTDKAGEPYILHPLRVMVKMRAEEQQIVAVLHDVVEDTLVSLSLLESEGFSPEIVDAIDRLTRRSHEPMSAYLDRVCESKLAVVVKLQDINDNLDARRLEKLDVETHARLVTKYVKMGNYIGQRLGLRRLGAPR